MKPLILPAILFVVAIAAFLLLPNTWPPCISKGTITSIPWLECK